ncbi:MAG TPA: NADH-quinone oxidoreductase subunit NuoG [Chryseosolibacter sp.]|nr:NADH-quinone oxidoreductase subunit NuoG [Chryseosolibacter sp.]
MATLYIDNKPYEVKSGKNLLETCLTLGFDLPYFCWHPALGSVGACRQCAIKVYKDENDKKGRLIMSCMEPVTDKQRISIADGEAKEFRENVIESLMTNHPHDCAVCDEGGSCHLQDMTLMSGHNYRRFEYKKRTHKNQYLGPFLNHEMNRCIQCYRCVRFYRDYAGGDDLDVFASRSNVYFGRAKDGVLENEFSGNLSEVCPTGVFTDKTLKEHYTRKWDLTMAPSVCQHCSLGCNTIAGERYGELRVIMNRYHGELNGYFICDRGRFGYQYVNGNDRIKVPRLNGNEIDHKQVLAEVATAFTSGKKVIGIGSSRASLQSNFALKTLVGEDNFYHGVTDDEHHMAELVIKILKEGSVAGATIKDVELSDAVLVLGEDLTNTAPRLALAVRQAAKQKHLPQTSACGIPQWHDNAVREIIQDKKGSVFIATLTNTKLDDIAEATCRGIPDNLGRIGFAIASLIDEAHPTVNNLSLEEITYAKQVAKALLKAERPVIIAGASCESECMIKAAANIAWALKAKGKEAKVTFTLTECNSLGLAMIGGHRLGSAFNAIVNGHADTAIILENDLYRHAKQKTVDEFLKKAKNLFVIDSNETETSKLATMVIPAGTFAESDGTLINNEGRAQRFFQVYEATQVVKESWRWIMEIGQRINHPVVSKWSSISDVTKAISEKETLLKGVEETSPAADFRISGQKIPREPHRYSGRTSMLANINVSEPKPPVDSDSPLSYTMEGYRGQPPPSMIPFYWSPGWNSVQSVNKYQEEVGAALKGGDPGVRLLHPNSTAKYFTAIPDIYKPIDGQLWAVSVHHIFGSDELSAKSKSVAERVPAAYVLLNSEEAIAKEVREGEMLSFQIDGQDYELPVKTNDHLPKGVIGFPVGLPDLPFSDLPAWAILKTKTISSKQFSTSTP